MKKCPKLRPKLKKNQRLTGFSVFVVSSDKRTKLKNFLAVFVVFTTNQNFQASKLGYIAITFFIENIFRSV